MHNRQLALFRLRRIDEALVEARAVVELRRRILPPNHRDLARSLGSLATIESSLGELEEARALRREGIDMLRAQKSPDQLLLGQELTNQGVDDYRLADLDSAARDLREAIERLQPQLGAEHARVLSARSYLALVQIYRGELIEAERELRLISAIEDNQERGGISDTEMYEVFNMGLGFVVVVDDDASAKTVIDVCARFNHPAQIIGRIESGTGRSVTVPPKNLTYR